MHELMHLQFELSEWDDSLKEEFMITSVEKETYKLVNFIASIKSAELLRSSSICSSTQIHWFVELLYFPLLYKSLMCWMLFTSVVFCSAFFNIAYSY